ncbi:MAG: polysaccharide ABC transporter ATP-binding protein [Syntrophales bacterium]|jgi:lipopolysaccharide transport system ATP-binding protein|nr:polysaccharide ABC transporter ATP-binding protein [Syntrophales bacterium]
MNDIVIKAENIGKKYTIGHQAQHGGYTALRDVLAQNARTLWNKTKDLATGKAIIQGDTMEEVWALKDVSFEIKRGEAVGIIGRNGAGKSTLLKILSRITEPSTGRVTIKGRVASLLEVGTGFHPELSGRENIYLNGAILGMSREEIKRKFDEIVAFAEVDKYLDTPVKRYSSGMYVRLAFAVAAHLEPEILVVDEVLAVGDAQFQKKCLGKMGDVAKGGRTVLFVSHNMAAIQNLCKKSILISQGILESFGDTQHVINQYIGGYEIKNVLLSEIKNRKGNGLLRFTRGIIKSAHSEQVARVETFSEVSIEIEFVLQQKKNFISARLDIGINNYVGDRVAWLSSDSVDAKIDFLKGKVVFVIQNFPLAPGDYSCNLYCQVNNDVADWISNVMHFSVIEKDYYGTGRTVPQNQGNILLNYRVII